MGYNWQKRIWLYVNGVINVQLVLDLTFFQILDFVLKNV